MSFTFEEMHDSRSGDDNSQTRRYVAYGSSDDVLIQNYARSQVPSVIVTGVGNLWRQPLQYEWNGPHCIVTAPFAKPSSNSPPTGSFTWNFDTTGGTVTIKAAKSHVATFPDPGGDGNPFKGAIGATKDGVEGTDVIIPALKFNVTFRHPQGIINLNRVFALADATGTSNSDTFFTKTAGSFLFLGATGGDGSESEAEVTYQFAYSKNLQNAVIGGINNINKDGWDYAWLQFKDEVFNAAIPVKQPLYVHVERVYDRLAFGTLFGFG